MSSALFQLMAIGEEDKAIMSEGFDALRPFRQVYRRQTLFAQEFIDIDARFPTPITYGQTLSNIQIPRKGDLLRGLTISFKVKRASGSTRFQAMELIEEISLYSGKTLLERVRGDWVYVQKKLSEDADGWTATERMTEFQADETQGSVKDLYLEVPFFCCKTPIPLIAMPLQTLTLELKLRNAPASLDPTYQPIVTLLGEYIVVDDDERRWFTKNAHDLLIERVQIEEHGFDPRKSKITKLYTVVNDSLGGYDRVTGSGETKPINLGTYIKLVDNPGWLGRTDIFYDQQPDTVRHKLRGRFSVPLEGTMGMGWAGYTAPGGSDHGYSLEFTTSASGTLTTTLKRDGSVVCRIGNSGAESSVYATVTGADTSTDYTAQLAVGEAWIVYDVYHDSEADLLTISLTIEGYVLGGYFASLSPVNSMSLNYTVREGYTPIDTTGIVTQLSFFGDSLYDVFFVPTTLEMQTVKSVPTVDNFLTLNAEYFFRGPVRYLVWWYKYVNWEFGKTSTDAVESTSIRHDMEHSASILINGKERPQRRMPSSFYTLCEPKRLFGRSLPTGVHAFGFAEGRVDELSPNGTLNISRVGDFRIQHVIRSYSETQTNITRLDESETLPSGALFNRVTCAAVGYNVIRIDSGRLFIAYT
jgi:hypothetical protein